MNTVAFAIVVPFICAGLVMRFTNRPNGREAISLLASAILFVFNLLLLPSVLAGDLPTVKVADPIPGLPIIFRVEPLGLLFGILSSFLWLITTVYSIGYLRAHHEPNQSRFFTFFALAIGSTIGVAFSGNLLT